MISDTTATRAANGKAFVKGLGVAFLQRHRIVSWADLFVILALAGGFLGVVDLASEWTTPSPRAIAIDLSPWALPQYTFFSLARGILAFFLSLGFTLVYGYWAAKDPLAERLLIPLLDILQSVPVLGFMPGLILALLALFPSTNTGLEIAAILMIFTGQAWNMTFSFYHSLRSLPAGQKEVAAVYRFSWWQRFRWVELPSAAIGLIWNSMMSMAGGWFFLMISETFVLGHRDFRLPGVGSYMNVAVAEGNVPAMVWAIVAMVVMIVMLDQFLWRPVVAWGQKFRSEETGQQEVVRSWFLEWVRSARLLWSAARSGARFKFWLYQRLFRPKGPELRTSRRQTSVPSARPRVLSIVLFLGLLAVIVYSIVRFEHLLRHLSQAAWDSILWASLLTLGRVLIATAVGTLWALPAGLAIGLSPKLSRALQPVVQVAASFPAPMLFPVAMAVLRLAGISLGWGAIVLMLLGTQWYILFNVIAGAMAIPHDLREMARSYRIRGLRRFWSIYVPAVLPYLVTGWVTAAGGAWNASIVAEYVTFRGHVVTAHGLGAQISRAAEQADFASLAAEVLTMSVVVVLFNRAVWRPLYRIAEQRFTTES